MKTINRILASLLFLAFLVPFTTLWQEETSATETCPGTTDVDITVEGTGKNKAQARDDLDDKIADEANAICSGTCYEGACKVIDITTTGVNCKYFRRDRSWRCTATIKRVECGCVEEVEDDGPG